MVRDRKHHAALELKKYLGIKSYAVIVFEDTVGVVRLWEKPDAEDDARRHDRGTTAPHVYYNVDRLDYHPELLDPILQTVQLAKSA